MENALRGSCGLGICTIEYGSWLTMILAATLIMDDDVDGAEEGLKKGNSPFHKLGKGVVAFVRATLGFEQDIMRQGTTVSLISSSLQTGKIGY